MNLSRIFVFSLHHEAIAELQPSHQRPAIATRYSFFGKVGGAVMAN